MKAGSPFISFSATTPKVGNNQIRSTPWRSIAARRAVRSRYSGRIGSTSWPAMPKSADPLFLNVSCNAPGFATRSKVGSMIMRSKRSPLENHLHALSIYFMHYNFVRIHQTLRCTPAMEAKVTDRLWSLEDIIAMVDDWE